MKNVTIYSSSSCQYCIAAKDFFKRNNIDYTEKNISEDMEARKELMQKGVMGVPFIIIGDEEIAGFNEPKIKEALGL